MVSCQIACGYLGFSRLPFCTSLSHFLIGNSDIQCVFRDIDADLQAAGILGECPYGLKVLAGGELTKKLTVKASAFSESAKEKIEQAGGKAEVV